MEASDYNDAIVDVQNEIGDRILEFSGMLGMQNYKGAEIHIANVLAATESGVSEIEALPPFEGNTAFRDAALDLFRFYDKTFRNEYPEMLSLVKKGNMSEEDNLRFMNLLEGVARGEQQYDEAFRLAQMEFATRHKISLHDSDYTQKSDSLNNAQGEEDKEE